jgi:hypothetical protein
MCSGLLVKVGLCFLGVESGGIKYVMFGVSGCCTGSVHISLLLNIMDMQLHACSRKKTIFLRFG